jgi:7-keto-8-aminopelargonate synthetase-like enzyme
MLRRITIGNTTECRYMVKPRDNPVPIGQVRIRVQLSSAHTDDDIESCVAAFIGARGDFG